MEKQINYKEQDRQAILDYLAGKGEVEVAKVMAESGANTLRVYVLIYELRDAGKIEITRSNDWGTPMAVKLTE